jgi:hypothetical protein
MRSPILAHGCRCSRSLPSSVPQSPSNPHSSIATAAPASIEATFDLFKTVNRVRRVYWRGLEEASWLATMQARPENPHCHSLWTWLEQLYAQVIVGRLPSAIFDSVRRHAV